MGDFFTSRRFVDLTEKALNKVLGGFADKLTDGPEFVTAASDGKKYFYAGNEKFRKTPAKNAGWSLGYACVDLTPKDYKERDYYLGGYLTPDNGFNNRIENTVDKMMCRIISLDDGSERGVSLFATIDCIGTGNKHIKLIRRRLDDLLRINGITDRPASVNVFSTHAHSCVDTQGLWTATGKKAVRNLKKNRSGKGTYISGPDEEYMDFLTMTIAEGMYRAYTDMHPGTLTFTRKDIGKEYFVNKNRKSATSLVTDMIRFIFTPDDETIRPTLIASVAAHPDVAGLPTSDGSGTGRELCGEYIYYMGEFVNRAGYNFMFINGAICAIYMARGATNDGVSFTHRYEQSIRYGRELAKIALSLSKTAEEIENTPLLADKENVEKDRAESEKNGIRYTLWYENWTPVKEKKVAPLLNIRLTQVTIPVTNPLIKIVGKLNLAAYKVIVLGNNQYAITTEAGVVQIGKEFTSVLVPGEFCQDLLVGGDSLNAAGAWSGTDFGFPSANEIFGEGTYAFGLANDAIGYIVPDNDYVLGEFSEHYHELISLGSKTASSIMNALNDLSKKIKGE